MGENIIEVRELTKYYPGTTALDRVSFDIKKGTVHCIVGENGAGKSTFVGILSGAVKRSSGKIIYKGVDYNPANIRDAMKSGMSFLFQELNVVESLTVEENLTLGMEETRYGFIRRRGGARSFDLLKSFAPNMRLDARVSDLSVAEKQIIEIVKAIAADASIVVMDEPTAALSEEEARRLFGIINELTRRGVTVIYISHRLDEIFEIGQYVTVLRDGHCVGTKRVADISSPSELITMMTGRAVEESYAPSEVDHNRKVLEARSLSNKRLKGVSFELYKGEILGFYGLRGAGKTEIARAIYGVDKVEGTLFVNGRAVKINSPRAAIKSGICMVPEERRTQGLIGKLSIRENIPLMNMRKISRFMLTSGEREKQLARMYIEKLRIVTDSENKRVSLLSGGNQQKVVLAKCLNAEAEVMLLDEPTRGIDVGARQEIYKIIRDLSKEGKSVIVFSSDLSEILSVCDRIVLLRDGEVKAVVKNGRDVSKEEIMEIVTGGNWGNHGTKD